MPTETWREVVARRTRYQDTWAKLSAGEITLVNDLITYNLDSRRFVEDVITYCTGTDLLRALYDSIEHVTVLDPTCGSGAFLFSALGILEGLYEACLDRMQDLVEEREVLDAAMLPEKRHRSPDITHFQAILERVKHHPSRAYFIYKSIIIRNLYGVDIMEEATEICKLRLFLKLVSQIERFDDIEPLPDIDFNIRSGNTLVGFASYEETKQAIEGKTVGKAFQNQMIFDDRLERIKQKAQDIECAFEQFRELQTEQDLDPVVLATHKQQLQQMLGILRLELDGYLASEYGIDRNSLPKKEEYSARFVLWQQSHQPFHWWVEFYGIMRQGGFNVIIGNPPYVEYSKVRNIYRINNYITEASGNLYNYVVERCSNLLQIRGKCGLIVPLSGFFTERMNSYQDHIYKRYNLLHISYFSGDAHPSIMFSGVKYRLCILIAAFNDNVSSAIYTSDYLRWYSGARENLFTTLFYDLCTFSKGFLRFAKIGSAKSKSALQKLLASHRTLSGYLQKSGEGHINYHRSPVFWIRAMDFEPYFHSATRERSLDHLKDLHFSTQRFARAIGAVLNSTCFYYWFVIQGNCRDVAGPDITSFPIDELDTTTVAALDDAFTRLMADLHVHSKRRVYNYEYSGLVEYDEFYPKYSKPIIDEIDRVLARHYSFTDEELDFIINYDIKYRMGQVSGSDEDEE